MQPRFPLSDFRPEYLRHYGVLPLGKSGNRLQLAVSAGVDPDPDVLDDLRRTYDCDLDLVAVDNEELNESIRAAFAAQESVGGLVEDLGSENPIAGLVDDHITDARDLASQPPVIRLVNLLIKEANQLGASDVHLEATSTGLRVRARIDGILSRLPSPPRHLESAVVSRLKLLAELDIAERRVPQDGRIRVRLEARELDLRISTVPSQYGESVVVRLLDRGGRPTSLSAVSRVWLSGRTRPRFGFVRTA